MPWKETCAMTERLRFIALVEEGSATMAALCRQFGISRKTGYQLLARYAAEGAEGLRDRSHAAHHHPHAVSEAIEGSIVALRAKHPTWGARKLRARLQMDDPTARWPVASTIGDILHRHGLVIPRRRRVRAPADTSPFAACAGPNDGWCIDYKGQFRLGDRSLNIAYWLPDREMFVDDRGHRVTLPAAGSGRAWTAVERDGNRVAAIVHDAELDATPELVHAAASAAVLALDNEPTCGRGWRSCGTRAAGSSRPRTTPGARPSATCTTARSSSSSRSRSTSGSCARSSRSSRSWRRRWRS